MNAPVVVSANALAALVKPVMEIAGKDDMLPVLNAVLVETRGDYLVASATDRFRVAYHRVKLTAGQKNPKTPPAFRALIPLVSLRALFRAFTPARGINYDLHLSLDPHDDQRLVVEMPDPATISIDKGRAMVDPAVAAAVMRFRVLTNGFPNLEKLVREALARDPEPGVVGFNWELLASFKAFRRSTLDTFVVKTHPVKPTVITDDDRFVGLIMPRRIPSTGRPPLVLDDDWADVILADPTTKKEVAAS